MTLKDNTLNNIPAGTLLFSEGEEVTHICAILKGSVEMLHNGLRLTLKSGSMFGITDAFSNKYQCSYVVKETAALYVFSVKGEQGMSLFLNKYMDYRGISVAAMSRLTTAVAQIRDKLILSTRTLAVAIETYYRLYHEKAKSAAITFADIESLSQPELTASADAQELICRAEQAQLPMETHKFYYENCVNLAVSENEKMSLLIGRLLMDCSLLKDHARNMLEITINRENTSLYEVVVGQIVANNGQHEIDAELVSLLGEIKDMLLKLGDTLEEYTGEGMLDTAKLRRLYLTVTKEGVAMRREAAENEAARAEIRIQSRLAFLSNSVNQILEFSELDEVKAAVFRDAVEYLVNAPDKAAVSDEMRKKKHALTPIFYRIYENCLKKSLESEPPYPVELLLDYGYIDERLLNEKQLRYLCSREPDEYDGRYNIYTMREWLTMIYQGQKDPSRNEFAEDYFAHLRTRRKNGEITDEELNELTFDYDARLTFEIDNLFACNMRACNGQVSTFAPVLYGDVFFSNMEKADLRKADIEQTIDKIRGIDYSIFAHETRYDNPELDIRNEQIFIEVTPNIILLPVYGQKSSMWQEIEGSKRTSPARVLIPMFSDTPAADLCIEFMGRYRWEYTKCIEGIYWNDISNRCLTSVYSDYVTYYRKNRELSEVTRDKIKLQLQKAKNNMREMFATDYMTWIKYEFTGSMRLNKVAREILATYVPFPAPDRMRLEKLPAFAQAFERYEQDAAKESRRLMLKIRQIEAKGENAPDELKDKLNLYAVNLD